MFYRDCYDLPTVPLLTDDHSVYDSLPASSLALPEELGLLLDVRAAYVYDRKDYATADRIGAERNASYGSKNDPIILQLQFFLKPGDAMYGNLHEIHESVLAAIKDEELHRLEAQRRAIDERIATLKA